MSRAEKRILKQNSRSKWRNWKRIHYRQQKGRCYYCNGGASTLDHKIPLSRGGPNTRENTVLACYTCNQAKAAKTVEEFLGA